MFTKEKRDRNDKCGMGKAFKGRAYFSCVLSYLGLFKELISFCSFWIITDSAEESPSRGSGMWQGCHNTSINNSWKACAARADFSPLPGCGMPGVPLGKEISQFQVLSWERLTPCALSFLQTGYRDLAQTLPEKLFQWPLPRRKGMAVFPSVMGSANSQLDRI